MKSIMQEDDKCYLCGNAFGSEWHHVFPGRPNRRHSEEDGMKVRLCHDCHWRAHNDTQESGILLTAMKRAAQAKYEVTHSREDFIKRYGRNYL